MLCDGLNYLIPGGDSVTIDNELAPLSVHNDGEACRPKSQLEIADAIEAQL